MKKISKSAYNLPVFFINSSFSLNFMKLQILNYLFRRSNHEYANSAESINVLSRKFKAKNFKLTRR